MGPYRLQTRCLPEGARAPTSLLRPMQSQQVTRLHAAGTTRVEWYCITQLVVRREYQELRPATTLLSMLDGGDDVFGIMGSQPAACKALSNAFRGESAQIRRTLRETKPPRSWRPLGSRRQWNGMRVD